MARTTDNEHSGHRERMRKKFIENGFDVFETHEALEMFLYYAIPRKDTNPLAPKPPVPAVAKLMLSASKTGILPTIRNINSSVVKPK